MLTSLNVGMRPDGEKIAKNTGATQVQSKHRPSQHKRSKPETRSSRLTVALRAIATWLSRCQVRKTATWTSEVCASTTEHDLGQRYDKERQLFALEKETVSFNNWVSAPQACLT